MKCPVCNVELHMTERQGVEIDYCPNCRGVWLDRGELDKIIDKAADGHGKTPAAGREYYRGDNRGYQNDPYPKKRKGGIIGELFDF